MHFFDILPFFAIYGNIRQYTAIYDHIFNIYAYRYIELGQYTAIIIYDVYYFSIRLYTTVYESRIYAYA
jgi:hypothetical protein